MVFVPTYENLYLKNLFWHFNQETYYCFSILYQYVVYLQLYALLDCYLVKMQYLKSFALRIFAFFKYIYSVIFCLSTRIRPFVSITIIFVFLCFHFHKKSMIQMFAYLVVSINISRRCTNIVTYQKIHDRCTNIVTYQFLT